MASSTHSPRQPTISRREWITRYRAAQSPQEAAAVFLQLLEQIAQPAPTATAPAPSRQPQPT